MTKPKVQPKTKESEKTKPGEIFVPSDQKRKTTKNSRRGSKEITASEQELIAKLSQNISLILNERLSHTYQEDLEFLINRGFLDESQALTLFQSTLASRGSFYSLTNDLYIAGFIPLVYSLHLGFLGLSVAVSLVHKYFTVKASILIYLAAKVGEILGFYYYSLYL